MLAASPTSWRVLPPLFGMQLRRIDAVAFDERRDPLVLVGLHQVSFGRLGDLLIHPPRVAFERVAEVSFVEQTPASHAPTLAEARACPKPSGRSEPVRRQRQTLTSSRPMVALSGPRGARARASVARASTQEIGGPPWCGRSRRDRMGASQRRPLGRSWRARNDRGTPRAEGRSAYETCAYRKCATLTSGTRQFQKGRCDLQAEALAGRPMGRPRDARADRAILEATLELIAE